MKAYIATVRYRPDPTRGEAINVGIVLASTQVGYYRHRVVVQGNVRRLRCFDPTFNEEVVRRSAEWIEDYGDMFGGLAAEERPERAEAILHELTRVTANEQIQVGTFRPIVFKSQIGTVELDEVLNDAFERDVRWYRHVDRQEAKGPSFRDRMDVVLRDARLYVPRSSRSPVKRDYPVPAIGLEFHYGYRNGHTNVLETADIRNVTSENSLVDKAASMIVKFQRLIEAEKNGEIIVTRRALLSGARPLGKGLSATVREIQDLSAVYFMGEDQDRRKLVADINNDMRESAAAHPVETRDPVR